MNKQDLQLVKDQFIRETASKYFIITGDNWETYNSFCDLFELPANKVFECVDLKEAIFDVRTNAKHGVYNVQILDAVGILNLLVNEETNGSKENV